MAEESQLVTVARRFEWDALHRVPGHDGACRAFHGHRYSAEVECEGAVQESGMIIDFGLLKSIVGQWIDRHWDHTALLWVHDSDPAVEAICRCNERFGKPVYLLAHPPTAEHIALELSQVATSLLAPHSIAVRTVRVYETPNCSAAVSR